MALFGRPTIAEQQRADAWRDWMRARNPLAIASLVLGIFSLIEFGALLIFGIAGIVLGVMALRQLQRSGASTANLPVLEEPDSDAPALRQAQGHRLAWSGIVLSVISLVIAAVIYLLLHGPR